MRSFFSGRRIAAAALVSLGASSVPARADTPFAAAPAASVPGYYAEPMPCKVAREGRTLVTCKGDLLESKSLRELSILRNTIFARYGWDGYRKPWLKAHFHAQSWFKPNPKFNYKQLSEADRKNAHFIGVREQSFTSEDLDEMKRKVTAHKPLSADDKIELGLISRASGSFSLDEEAREKSESSLERILSAAELRQLSLRDLRLLRNTIYAHHGRPFKSQILQDHFNGMSWYRIDKDYDDKLLTKNDTRNIALIKSVENEFGGPMSDEDWLQEPATDGA